MQAINFITSNKGKFLALERALKAENAGEVEVVAQDLDLLEPQFDTVKEVSLYKAQRAFEMLQKPVLVEDGGFCIAALNEFPGVYTKYVIKTIGADGIIKLLEGVEDRRARFISYATYIDAAGTVRQFERKGGEVDICCRKVNIDSPYAWSELWKIIYVKKYGKALCEMSKAEVDDYMAGTSVEGSLQQFARWYVREGGK